VADGSRVIGPGDATTVIAAGTTNSATMDGRRRWLGFEERDSKVYRLTRRHDP